MPSDMVRVNSNQSTTPLGYCALFDNEGLLVLLLHARADPEIKNNRGLRPIDIASSERIRAILRDPMPHMYLQEHDFDIVQATL